LSKYQKPLAISLIAVAVMVISLLLDPVLAGKVPQSGSATLFFNFFSGIIGNGGFLLAVAAVLYLLGVGLGSQELNVAGRSGVLAVAISGAVVQVLKAAFERPRPGYPGDHVLPLLQNPTLFDLSSKYASFPSGHTAVSFAVAYVLSKSFPRLRLFFYAMAAFVAASRVYLGAHYPSDVAAGALLGLCIGWLLINDIRIKERWKISGLVLLVVFIAFFKLGGYLLFDVDEAVFSEASREMVTTGDYITPTYNFEPRYDKPILFYWFMSLSYRLFGINEFAARFTSAGFGALLVLMTFFFVRRVRGNTAAYLSALFLLLNLEFFVYSHSAVTDMTLSFFIAASIYSFYLGVSENSRSWFIPFWVSAALATLTKGVIGTLFPVSITFLYLASTKNLSKLKDVFRPAYIILFPLVAAPWFAAEFYVNGWDFFNAFIIKHHIKRFAEANSLHSGPFYFYIIVLLAGFFPWVAMLPGAIYRGFKERLGAENGLYLLSSIWFVLVLVFFTISRTKLPNYIFPLFPSAAVLAGLYSSDFLAHGKSGKIALFFIVAFSVLIGAALIALPFLNVKMTIPFPAKFFLTLGAVFVVIAFFSIVAFFIPRLSFAGMFASMGFLLIFLRLHALPPVNLALQRPLYDFSVQAKGLDKNGVLSTYEVNAPSIAFYSQRKIVKTEKSTTCDIREHLKRRSQILVITKASKYGELNEFKDLKVLGSEGEYMLLGNTEIPRPQ
jgi:4-amino-4-deoxy-L-arabinose transferase-like glycosyltransferase/membrane-associated phospholipid phosphatase